MTSDDDAQDITKDKAARVGRAAKDAASQTAGEVSQAADHAPEVVDDLYGRAQSAVIDAANKLPGSASDALAAGQSAYQTGSERVARQVAKQPLEALFLAGAIGFLVGWAANRT